MAFNFGPRAHFTYVWTVENVTPSFFEKSLISPVFTATSMEMTQWCLELKILNQEMLLNLHRVQDNGPEQIEICHELSIIDDDLVHLYSSKHNKVFVKGGGSQFLRIQIENLSFHIENERILEKDVITVKCHMWREVIETLNSEVCYARTHFGLDRHRFVWTINNFSSLSLDQKITRKLKSRTEEYPDRTLIFGFRQNMDLEAYAYIDVKETEAKVEVEGKIALLNAYGEIEDLKTIWKPAYKKEINRSLPPFLEKRMLLSNKATLLPNDVLSFRCEIVIRYGPLWSGIENCAELEYFEQHTDEYVVQNRVNEKIAEETVESACPFKDNIHKFYEDGTLGDIILRADSEKFIVHKIILSSRSPVFKSMFTNDMKEEEEALIPDMNAATLRRLLLYIYKNEVPKAQWEEAADLFRAADKFMLLELKKKCSVILKSSISQTNVCGVLSLAYMHHDEELYKTAVDFVSQNLDICNSETWKTFKKENPKLAIEALEKIIHTKNSK